MLRLLLLSFSCAILLAASSSAHDKDSFQQGLKQADSEEAKIIILDQIMAWGRDGGAEAAESALELLGAALLRGEWSVRVHAASLHTGELGKQATLTHLLQGARQLSPRYRKLCAQLQEVIDASEKRRMKNGLPKTGTISETLERSQWAIDEGERFIEEAFAISDELRLLRALRLEVTARLLQLPSDEAVEGIVLMLGDTPEARDDPLVDALLELGSAAALQPLATLLSDYAKEHKRDERALREARKDMKRSSKKPKKYVGSDKQWRRSVETHFGRVISDLQERMDSRQAWANSLASRLRHFAAKHALDAPPTELLAGSRWRSWSKKVAAKLPGTLSELASDETTSDH